MIHIPWLPHPLTEEQVRDHFMLMLEDDTENKPWMTMGDLQFWSAAGFAYCLRFYARERGLPWYVASMHPIIYSWHGSPTKKQFAPDVYVAFVPDHPRPSFDVAREGGFPPFVLEVVSPASVERDRIEKREAYDALGVQEYALFTPRDNEPSSLEGYQRTSGGHFAPWPPDAEGRLWSQTLGLFLAIRGASLQAVTPEGELLLTPDQDRTARRQAEAEIQRLRAELERGRGDAI